MIHLVDTDELISATDKRDFLANCSLRLLATRAKLRNDWAVGQCKEWLDRVDICGDCRIEAMEPKDSRFTYGIRCAA